MSNSYKVSKIAKFLKKEFFGKNYNINKVRSANNLSDHSVTFINSKNFQFSNLKKCLIICIKDQHIDSYANCTVIYSSNPRLDFIKLSHHFFYKKKKIKISKSAQISKNCKIAKDVSIGDYSVIKDNVSIGSGTVINNHVVIESNTIIGKNCYIKSGAIIGEEGFGFEKDENGVPIRFPHFGNVIIGNNVEVGASSVIARGTLESTKIEDNVKIDDQVFIAHNVTIDRNSMIVACSEISGSSKIGKNCWIGPNSTIKDQVVIGDNVFLGMGSIISENVRDKDKKCSLSNLSLRDSVKINNFLKSKK